MVVSAYDDKFFETTRGRIVALLRRATCTVEELARALGLTDNAVRLHLGTLERDGIVRGGGVRRDGGVGKPANLYEIDPGAEPAFSNAYVPFLTSLLAALGERMSTRELRTLMRDVGHRLAGAPPTGPADVMARTRRASELLNALGGVTSVERDPNENSVLHIRGRGCPLSVAVAEREEVCLAMQTMLRDVVGVEVRERCDRTDRPCCCFEIPLTD